MKQIDKKRIIIFKMESAYTLVYWKEKGWLVGKLREIPGVFSQGRTLKELRENIEDAYRLLLDDEKKSLPLPPRTKLREVQVYL